jgi:hypothetical protein
MAIALFKVQQINLMEIITNKSNQTQQFIN